MNFNKKTEESDYSFTGGGVTHRRISFGKSGQLWVSGEKLYPITEKTPPTGSEVFTKTREELGDDMARVATVHEMVDGQEVANERESVEYFVLNQKADPKNGVIISVMGFGGDARHPLSKRQMEIMAHANPGRQIIFLNNAGTGDSSVLPESVIKEMKRTGSFQPQADWAYSLLGDELDKYGDDIEIWGHSMGARLAIGLAAAHFAAKEKQISGLRLIDPVGAEAKGFLGMMGSYMITEGLRAAKYTKRSPYNETKQLPEYDGHPRIKRTWLERFSAMKQLFIDMPSVMGKAGLESDLQAAAPAVHDHITVVSPEKSALNRPEKIRRILGDLAVQPLRPQKIRQILLPHDSHSVISAGAGGRSMEAIYEIAGQK